MQGDAIWKDVAAIRARAPVVHNITNYVVMNNTANALLALGASPVMAHAAEEVEDMVGLTQAVGGALVINIGTLSERWIAAMKVAAAAARARRVPLVLDPVGAGATPYRTQTALELVRLAPPTVIRGNASEIMALAGAAVQTKGVDSSQASTAAVDAARALAAQTGGVVCVSGAEDQLTDGRAVRTLASGHPMMTKVTGLGCTATALIGAFVAVNPDALAATGHAMAVMGWCGEQAARVAAGPGTLQVQFIDALYQLNERDLRQRFP